MRTALSVVFTCCPPAPCDRMVSILRSLAGSSTPFAPPFPVNVRNMRQPQGASIGMTEHTVPQEVKEQNDREKPFATHLTPKAATSRSVRASSARRRLSLVVSPDAVSASGYTLTWEKDVCLRPAGSYGEFLTKRCTPASMRSHPYADSPATKTNTLRKPASSPGAEFNGRTSGAANILAHHRFHA